MASKLTRADRAIVRLADGTVKQQNLLTGTEVWTVPGRGNRPLAAPRADHDPIDHEAHGRHCAFCSKRYLETPPEKSRLVRHDDGTWEQLDALGADKLSDTVAEFRRIPNLFEIVSYNYWHLNHGHVPSEDDRRRMAHYLASDAGYEHVMNVVRARMLASGMSEGEFAATSETARLQAANGFFSGGHDLIVAKRHFVDGATEAHQLAGSGTLTPEEHAQYTAYTARSMRDLYDLDPAVRYVATFQNWLRPAGASFDHLHKQLVAIDDLAVQTEAELERLRAQPDIYDQIFTVAATRKLLIAQNEHAVALAGFGHRFPGIAIWPLHSPRNPPTRSGTTARRPCPRPCAGGSSSSGASPPWQASRAAPASTSTRSTRGRSSNARSPACASCATGASSRPCASATSAGSAPRCCATRRAQHARERMGGRAGRCLVSAVPTPRRRSPRHRRLSPRPRPARGRRSRSAA